MNGAKVMEDLTGFYLSGSSPYISALIYDPGNRRLTIECVADPATGVPCVQVCFEQVTAYSELPGDQVRAPDDDAVDSVIGMHWSAPGMMCIRTERREIEVSVAHPPLVRRVGIC
jgi:hypothetical protein